MRRTAPIPGELRVIAGDIEGDSVVSWVKTLLSDAFFWTENDLAVQTRSMYGGAPRAAGGDFPVRPGQQGLALQLLRQRADRRRGRRCAAAGSSAGVSPHWSVVLGRDLVHGCPCCLAEGRRAAVRAVHASGQARERRRASGPCGPRDQRDQRRSSVRAPAADARALRIATAHRNRACGRYAAGRRDERIARRGCVPERSGRAPDIRQHRSESRQSAAVAAAGGGHRRWPRRGGQAASRRARACGVPGGDRLVAASDRETGGRAGGVRNRFHAHRQRRRGHRRRAGGIARSRRGCATPTSALAETRWPIVGHLHFVELYLDRACEVWRTLQAQVEASPGEFVVAEAVRRRAGGAAALARLGLSRRGLRLPVRRDAGDDKR